MKISKKTNDKRPHANQFMRTSFANSGRIAGAGILYDDYSEESYSSSNEITDRTPVPKKIVEEKYKDFAKNGGPVITYNLKYEMEGD